MGPTRTESLGGKQYILVVVVVDDFSRYAWVEFFIDKTEAAKKIEKLCKRLQVEKDNSITRIRSDHRKEFKIFKWENFCDKHGI